MTARLIIGMKLKKRNFCMIENKAEQYCKLPIPIMAYQTDEEFDIETLEGTHYASVGD